MNQLTKRLKTVLVVEDNADDVRLLELASRKAQTGLALYSVPTGEEALAYLKGEGPFSDRQAHPLPDLVLLDLKLPRMDGFEVLAWIRNHPELRGLKVFVWTDSGQPEVLARATRAGANRFVPKSVSFVQGGSVGLINGILQAFQGPPTQETVPPGRVP
jgi:CheY-like chemotaxis protein